MSDFTVIQPKECCPFWLCQGVATVEHRVIELEDGQSFDTWYVQCQQCKATGPYAPDAHRAVHKWDARRPADVRGRSDD